MYCDVDDIRSEFANAIKFDASSKVTETDVNELITDESNYIDSMISSKYSVPVVVGTSPKAFAVLKRICIQRVSDVIRKRLEIKTGNTKIDQDTKGAMINSGGDLSKIVKGTLRLLDAELITVSTGLSHGTRDEAYKPFSLNKQQW